MKIHRIIIAACFAVTTLLSAVHSTAAQEIIDADILLKNGTIYDGSGKAAVQGDVAIRGDRIVAVGKFQVGAVNMQLDCTGLVIAPGFIDLHNHSDRQVISPKTRGNVNYLMMGCTTVLTGNCGSGPVDVGEYYNKIDAAGAGTNVAHLLPQGALRNDVMATADRAPTADELQQMKQLAAKAMQDGAWGMSTGLIYVPSSYAKTDELIEIAKVIAKHNGIYASHIRNENVQLLAAVDEAMQIGKQAGLPVHISHFKSSGRDSWGLVRRAAEMIEKARQSGQTVTADQYPYIASSTSLDAILIPTWARSGGRKKLIERFDDPELSKRIRDAMAENLVKRNGGEAVRIASYSKRQDWVGKNLVQISTAEKITPLQLAEQISRNGGAAIVNFSMNEDDVRHIMQIAWVATASDGGAKIPGPDRPHPRSYGTFSRKIGHYSLREKVLPLEQAIRSGSGLPADILGLKDRGYLKKGMFADILVFDPQEFIDTATFDNPHQYSLGAKYVFVNGQPAVFNGHPTGALAGKALKHKSNGK
ncbi:MAG: D-aminoacylase [Planctomycetes bacterium]|nr:D-aminoacylase [Planctomycetota bacterium]